MHFTKAYLEISNLRKSALEQMKVGRKECREEIMGKLTEELGPLLGQRESSAKRLEEANNAIQILKQILDNSDARVERLKEHLADLKKECLEAADATGHLKAIRKLILNLEHCPG